MTKPTTICKVISLQLIKINEKKNKVFTCQFRRHRFDPYVGTKSRRRQPFQYLRLKNPMNRGAWQATDHGVVKSRTWPSDWAWELSVFFSMVYFGASKWVLCKQCSTNMSFKFIFSISLVYNVYTHIFYMFCLFCNVVK